MIHRSSRVLGDKERYNYNKVRIRLIEAGLDLMQCGHGTTFDERGHPVCPIAKFAKMVCEGRLRPCPFRGVQNVAVKQLRVSFDAVNDFALWWDEHGYKRDGRGW